MHPCIAEVNSEDEGDDDDEPSTKIELDEDGFGLLPALEDQSLDDCKLMIRRYVTIAYRKCRSLLLFQSDLIIPPR